MHKFCEDMDPAAALTKTIGQLLHDAKKVFAAVVVNGFKYMIGDFFADNLVKPCVELVKPISEEIPEAFKVVDYRLNIFPLFFPGRESVVLFVFVCVDGLF